MFVGYVWFFLKHPFIASMCYEFFDDRTRKMLVFRDRLMNLFYATFVGHGVYSLSPCVCVCVCVCIYILLLNENFSVQ